MPVEMIGWGTAVAVYDTAGATGNQLFTGRVTSVNGIGVSNEAQQTTHMASSEAFNEFIYGISTNKPITITGWFDAVIDVASSRWKLGNRSAKSIKVTLPTQAGHSTGTTIVCNGVMTDLNIDVPYESPMGQSFEFTPSGPPVITVGS